ncbi:YesL family protein [Micromonospora sp. NBC_01813]|uniref:YesL family protein n=1 Tax=Micromonospora sp. NBC_01813 TaxID=2975988 RepID=UPI002DD9A5DA|nr:YesL family protein [Micromonospora sp. NBC_01813]WSA11299.1 YesL family protein [Micromonospora sp. NBC_01813]
MSGTVRRPVPAGRSLTARVNVGADTWSMIWSLVHRVLVVNLGLAVTNLPLLVALAVVAQPWRYPVFFGLLAVSIGPATAAAFGYLRRAEDDDRAPVREYFRAYRRNFAAATLRWSAGLALLAVLATDIVLLHDAGVAAVLVPLLVVTAVLVLAALVLLLAMVELAPGLGVRAAVRVAAWSAVRRAPLSLVSLALLLVAALSVNQAPLLALATLPGCALLVVWVNSRAALAPALPVVPVLRTVTGAESGAD